MFNTFSKFIKFIKFNTFTTFAMIATCANGANFTTRSAPLGRQVGSRQDGKTVSQKS